MKRLLVVFAFVVAAGTPAFAQSVASELSMTGGASTDEVTAEAMQGRVFADTSWMRVFGEVSWASVAGPHSDAFSAAYPYERRLRIMDAYGERTFGGERMLAGVRAGRFRTPFGIYGGSDHGYGGFIRAPYIRYAGYWALGNTFFEHGVNLMAGVPSMQVEYTLGTPSDVGEEVDRRQSGTDHVVRVQGYHGDLIVGASYIRTQPFAPKTPASRNVFSGIDVRWMRDGVQLRGEWVDGKPNDDPHTRGGYVDAFLHRREMGPVTVVARLEVLDFDHPVPANSVLARRATIGARVLVVDGLYATINGSHQTGAIYSNPEAPTSVDVGLTYTLRFAR
jgi:hypothetical protein